MMIPLCSLTMVYPLQKPSPHHTPCIKYFEFDNKTYRIKQGINKSHILVHCISEIFKIHLCSHVPTEFFYNELTTGFLHLFVISLICQNPVQVSLKRRLYSYYPFPSFFPQKTKLRIMPSQINMGFLADNASAMTSANASDLEFIMATSANA